MYSQNLGKDGSHRTDCNHDLTHKMHEYTKNAVPKFVRNVKTLLKFLVMYGYKKKLNKR